MAWISIWQRGCLSWLVRTSSSGLSEVRVAEATNLVQAVSVAQAAAVGADMAGAVDKERLGLLWTSGRSSTYSRH